jgi:hypothetical protein
LIWEILNLIEVGVRENVGSYDHIASAAVQQSMSRWLGNRFCGFIAPRLDEKLGECVIYPFLSG